MEFASYPTARASGLRSQSARTRWRWPSLRLSACAHAERLVPIVDRCERLFDRVLQHCERFHSVVDRTRAVTCRWRDSVRKFTRFLLPDVDGAIIDTHESRDAPDAMVLVEHGDAEKLME